MRLDDRSRTIFSMPNGPQIGRRAAMGGDGDQPRVSTESMARLSAGGAEVAQLLQSLEAVKNLLLQ